ncbi:hypothetical protein NEOLEDRAFT_1141909 [Neolentinus lepideus HHB14362 ss-1]|uniref:Uncharacterized protein n=1 Tax=Neolentinus lepideus HHB14362 ss-1 TaxID=1314782 RepID=A0A165NFD8_9AGAM|nr:hypothetical protein NEOLEDRAFT_1141909 [Neolentinus lepideus HHB14362 ss-1]
MQPTVPQIQRAVARRCSPNQYHKQDVTSLDPFAPALQAIAELQILLVRYTKHGMLDSERLLSCSRNERHLYTRDYGVAVKAAADAMPTFYTSYQASDYNKMVEDTDKHEHCAEYSSVPSSDNAVQEEDYEGLLLTYQSCPPWNDEFDLSYASTDASNCEALDDGDIIIHASTSSSLPHIVLTPAPPSDPWIGYSNCANARMRQDPAFLTTLEARCVYDDEWEGWEVPTEESLARYEEDDGEAGGRLGCYSSSSSQFKDLPEDDLGLVTVTVAPVDFDDEGEPSPSDDRPGLSSCCRGANSGEE